KFDRFAFRIPGLDFDGLWASNVRVHFGEAQAAFGADSGIAERFDLWVDQNQRHEGSNIGGRASNLQGGRPIFGRANVNDGELEALANLLGGQTDAGGL